MLSPFSQKKKERKEKKRKEKKNKPIRTTEQAAAGGGGSISPDGFTFLYSSNIIHLCKGNFTKIFQMILPLG
jgi:hypothetical protein